LSRVERALDAWVWRALGVPLGALATVLNAAARQDPLLARAIAQRDCVYRLENRDGTQAWHLVLSGGRARAARRAPHAPVSTLTFRRHAALRTLRPERLLSALVHGHVVQSGSTYDLYRLGFIFDLVRRRRFRPTAGARRPESAGVAS
jgi:hypothetical protein